MDNIKYLKRKFPNSYERILLHLNKDLVGQIKDGFRVFEIVDDTYWRFTDFEKGDIGIYKNYQLGDYSEEEDSRYMIVGDWTKHCVMLRKGELYFFDLHNNESIREITN